MKEKILAALDCALDDISEERLLDILLDAYKGKKKQIEKLESENAMERDNLRHAQESIREEQRRMRSDPLYMAHGRYAFICRGQKFAVEVQGNQITMFERFDKVDYAAQQMPLDAWDRI